MIWILGLLFFTQSTPLELRRAGRFEEAAVAFSKSEAPDDQTSAANLYAFKLGAPDRAKVLYDAVIRGGGDSPAVLRALNGRLFLEREAGGEAAELRLIRRIYRARAAEAQAPYLLIRASALLADDSPRAALRPLEALLTQFPDSTRVVDALMQKARLLDRLGEAREAQRTYRQVIGRRSETFGLGDENPPELDDAYLALAQIEERLGDLAAARSAYLRLCDDRPTSRLVDDALRAVIRIDKQLGRDSSGTEARLARYRAEGEAS